MHNHQIRMVMKCNAIQLCRIKGVKLAPAGELPVDCSALQEDDALETTDETSSV